jgi:hypothetical protein
MKKTILALMLLVGTCLFASAQVVQDCGAIDCPGRCGRFIDQNGDGFCDRGRLSSPAPTTQSTTETDAGKTEVATAVNTKGTKDTKSTKVQTIKEDPEGIAAESIETTPEPSTEAVAEEDTATEEPAEKAPQKKPYDLVLISLLTLGLYAFTFILVKTNAMKKTTHRKIWNTILLITALVSCLLGFFLVFQINYGWKMDWFWKVKFYHVEFGIAMTIVALFHIFWHMNYWKTLFKKRENKQEYKQ